MTVFSIQRNVRKLRASLASIRSVSLTLLQLRRKRTHPLVSQRQKLRRRFNRHSPSHCLAVCHISHVLSSASYLSHPRPLLRIFHTCLPGITDKTLTNAESASNLARILTGSPRACVLGHMRAYTNVHARVSTRIFLFHNLEHIHQSICEDHL